MHKMYLNEDTEKKKKVDPVLRGQDNKIATGDELLNNMHELTLISVKVLQTLLLHVYVKYLYMLVLFLGHVTYTV